MIASSVWARRTFWLATGLAVFGLWSGIDTFARDHIFMVNRTESLPNWAFFIVRQKRAAAGETVFFVPPRHPLVLAHFGDDPAPFGKIVYGVAGDEVAHRDNKVWLRAARTSVWREVATLKPVSMRGEPLEAGPTGVIPPGCYYAGTPHKDGFDSRYKAIGFICTERLVGVAKVAVL